MKQAERNFWLDLGLFITLLAITFTGLLLWLLIPHQTAAVFLGLNRQFWLYAHICSGLAGVAGIVIHIIWHRKWFKALRKRSITSLPAMLRANRVTDRFIWIIFLIVGVFGALDWITPTFETRASNFGRLHVAFGIAWLFGTTVHLTLHRHWIASATKHLLRIKKEENLVFPKPAGVEMRVSLKCTPHSGTRSGEGGGRCSAEMGEYKV